MGRDKDFSRKSNERLINEIKFLQIRITELEKAESCLRVFDQLLRKTQLQQKAILNNIPDIAWLKDNNSCYILVNEAFAKECNLRPEEVIGKNDFALWPQRLAEKYRIDDQKVIKNRRCFSFEEKLIDKTGKIKWVETVKTPIFNDGGEIIGTTGISRDISERRIHRERLKEAKAELEIRVRVRTAELSRINEELRREIAEKKRLYESLNQSEKKYRTLFEASPAAIFITDLREGIIKYVNQSACLLFGYTQEELLGLKIEHLHPKEYVDLVRKKFNLVSEGKKLSDIFPCKKKSGEVMFVSITGTKVMINNELFNVAFFLNVTEKIKKDKEIEKERNNFKKYMEVSQVMMLLIKNDQTVELINNKGCEVLGYPREDIIGKNWFDFFIPEKEREDVKAIFNNVFLKKSKALEYAENKILTKDGKERLIAWHSVLLEEDNKIIGVLSSGEDITEARRKKEELLNYQLKLENIVKERTQELQNELNLRKKAEEEGNDLKKRIEFILGATNTGLDIIDSDLNLLFVDSEWAKKYGDYNGKKCYEYFMGKTTECKGCGVRKALKTKEISVTEKQLVFEGGRPIQVMSMPYKTDGGRWLVAEVNVDISERKKVDEELRRYRDHLDDVLKERSEELLKEIVQHKEAQHKISLLAKDLSRSNKRLKQLALTDSHTGLYNHRYLGEVIEGEFQRAKRQALPLAVIMLDIDYFKSINDVYGHQFGDLILKQFAAQLKKMVRKYDVVIRYGGEEFIIISAGIDRNQALTFSQRILGALNLYTFGNKKHYIKLKISIGVVSYPEDKAIRAMDLVNTVDQVLNKVKESGGNRVFLASDLKRYSKSAKEEEKGFDIRLLKSKIDKLNKRANQSLTEAILAFAKAIELKDHYTGEHVEITGHYSTLISNKLGLSREEVELIRQASILHDLGKIGISEKILHKKNKLTKEEFEEIKKHPQIGADILRPVHFLHRLIPIIYYHHERWDGKGYPTGAKGEEIPIGARIIALADVYQALTSDRPYRKAYSKKKAAYIIKAGSGLQFDPKITGIFLDILKEEK